MAETGYPEIVEALRAAARLSKERFLVGIAEPADRARISAALAAEGEVVELPSADLALERLAEESFEMVVLDGQDGERNFLAKAREIRPFADVVPVITNDPACAAAMFIGEAAAVMPRPLPPSDALVRAHVRYLASCRRGRTRALMLSHVIASNRAALRTVEPALEAALVALVEASKQAPVVSVLGDGELARVAGGSPPQGQADVVVVSLGTADRVELRLRESRERASGAAVVAVDSAPTPERLAAAVYGGVRAYLGRALLPHLGRIVASAANRRRAELVGRQMAETLTRFGLMEDLGRSVPAGSLDLDASLIADAASSGTADAVVPSAHEVLVVDDEVVVLTVLREILRRSGYRVTTAASAEEAIELMQKRVFDLVLTDKNLPGASGLEVLRIARGLDPPPAVVMITGYSSYDSAVTALDIGAQDYIEKPIRDVEALRFRIRRALSRRNEQLARNREAGKREEQARIMVVEIDGTRRQLITEYLGRTYQVTSAANGEEALDLLKKSKFDLVIADRNLPGMSGLRVIEQAQRLLPHCASVLYTAYPSYETVKEAFEAGVDAYLVRPNQDLKALAEKIAGALRSHGGILLG